jgi:hypothetical protein
MAANSELFEHQRLSARSRVPLPIRTPVRQPDRIFGDRRTQVSMWPVPVFSGGLNKRRSYCALSAWRRRRELDAAAT